MLLSQQILDTIKRVIDGNFIFQQDGALMFIAFNTVQLLWCKTPISLSFWAMAPKRSRASLQQRHLGSHTAAAAWFVTKLNKLSHWRPKSGSALILHAKEKMQFLHFSISPDSGETLVRRGGIKDHLCIAYSLSNISAKNYENRLLCVEVIVCNVSVVFLRHSV